MALLINRHNALGCADTLRTMHRARKRVFVDLLRWQIPHDDFEERDQFDNDDAIYIVVTDPANGAHLASVRLLPTDRSHILGDLFPMLCEAPAPRGSDIWEITRFCLQPGIGGRVRREVRAELVQAFVEFALLAGIRAYTGVAHMAWLSQILAAGWAVRPLGLPAYVDGQLLGAIEISITPQTLGMLAPDWRTERAPLRVVGFDISLAA
jgi:N-acyl-L-homoserine lactone synthetase